MPPPREVVVCVDESGHSEAAWAWAADALLPCLPPRARVRLLCIAVPAAADAMGVGEDAPWTMAADDEARRAEQRSAMAAAQDTVRGLLARHPPPSGVDIVPLAVLMAGSVNETLDAILRKAPADIAVVGSRGMGTLRRLLSGLADVLVLASGQMGSVSSFCVQRLACPVVVVKMPLAQAQALAAQAAARR